MSRVRRPLTAFSTAPPKNQERSKAYLDWIRTLNCCVSGSPFDVIAHHVRLERIGEDDFKSTQRMGKRPSDFQCVPLRTDLHEGYDYSLHKTTSETAWWKAKHLDPLEMALELEMMFGRGFRTSEQANIAIKKMRLRQQFERAPRSKITER